MRAFITAIGLSFLVTAAAFAQQQRNEVALYLSDLSNQGDMEKPHWYGGFGLSYTHTFASRFAVDVSAVKEDRRTYSYVVNPANGTFTDVPPENITVYPMSAGVSYHWFNDTRWVPYVGAGLRYVAAPGNVDPRFGYENKLNGQIDGGFTFKMTRSVGWLVKATAVVGDHEPYDSPFRLATGVTFHF